MHARRLRVFRRPTLAARRCSNLTSRTYSNATAQKNTEASAGRDGPDKRRGFGCEVLLTSWLHEHRYRRWRHSLGHRQVSFNTIWYSIRSFCCWSVCFGAGCHLTCRVTMIRDQRLQRQYKQYQAYRKRRPTGALGMTPGPGQGLHPIVRSAIFRRLAAVMAKHPLRQSSNLVPTTLLGGLRTLMIMITRRWIVPAAGSSRLVPCFSNNVTLSMTITR